MGWVVFFWCKIVKVKNRYDNIYFGSDKASVQVYYINTLEKKHFLYCMDDGEKPLKCLYSEGVN